MLTRRIRTLLACLTVWGVQMVPAAAWASHGVDGTPHWTIPWYATALLMAVPYLAIALVAAVVYRLLRREFGN